jgi:S1-C subfamily serine protease
MKRALGALFTAILQWGFAISATAQDSPTSEPSVRMIQKIVPAVVFITTESIMKSDRNGPDRLFEDLFGSPIGGRKAVGTGSGFFVTADGFVVTNQHVIEGATARGITVTTQDGKSFPARLVSDNKERDLALLKVEAKEALPFIRLDDLSPNLLGQSVFVLGNPHGLGMSVSRGILSARARTLKMDGEEFPDLLQTDAAINPGNSGGPIVDLSGKLVAVSCMVVYGGERRQAVGLNFGVAGNVVRAKVEEFMKKAGGAAAAPKAPKNSLGIPGL